MQRPDLETTLERIATGARLLGMGWVILLALVALARHTDRISAAGWVAGSLVLALMWGAIAAWRARLDTRFSISLPAICVDTAVAAVALVAPTLAGIGDVPFYGGLPLIVVAIGAVRGGMAAWVVSSMFIAVVLVRTGASSVAGVVASITQIVMYLAAAFIFTWAVRVLRTSEMKRILATEAAARAEERAEISRHLHDSVLQTLALIQRAGERPDEVRSLARRQEGELRDWLYGEAVTTGGGFAQMLRQAGSEVEAKFGLPVEVVVVGDIAGSSPVEGIVAAAREAMVNASEHSGADRVEIFGEVTPHRITVFVRDRGSGFDPVALAPDRGGIRDSIRGRMESVGGSAQIRSENGWGSEWRLEVPR